MFCRKCKYTSFDSFPSCPLCGYDWGKEKKDLNLHWLVPGASPSDTGEPAAASEESPATASFQVRTGQQGASPSQRSSGAKAGPETARQPPSAHEEAKGPSQPAATGHRLVEPAEDSDVQEIEYSFEDAPAEPESGDRAKGPMEDASPSEQEEEEEEEMILLEEPEEIEIGLDEENEPPRDRDAGGDALPRPGGQNRAQAESDDEDDEWSAFIEEIELDSSEPSDRDPEKNTDKR